MAEDIKFTYDRFLTEKGNANRSILAAVDREEVVDRYTLQFLLKEPYVWLVNARANPWSMWIVAPEVLHHFGDLKKPETAIGTGPFMLERYEPNVKAVFTRQPRRRPVAGPVGWQGGTKASVGTQAGHVACDGGASPVEGGGTGGPEAGSHELNRLLRGVTDTTFLSMGDQAPRVPSGVRYVITRDADTRLPRRAACRLIGTMAHPLNRPQFDPRIGRVIKGYAVLQPRVTPTFPMDPKGSLFQKVFSGPSGIDPYTSAVSGVYQDLFAEGSYIGKGIYDIDAFEASLAGRVPENTLLSHDLLAGIFARAGLVTDSEFFNGLGSFGANGRK